MEQKYSALGGVQDRGGAGFSGSCVGVHTVRQGTQHLEVVSSLDVVQGTLCLGLVSTLWDRVSIIGWIVLPDAFPVVPKKRQYSSVSSVLCLLEQEASSLLEQG